MDCNKIKEYIHSFLDGELDDQTSSSVKQHFLTCPLCSMELEGEKKVDFLIRNNIPKEKAPYELKETILSQIKESEKRKVGLFIRPILKPVLAACITVLLVITVASSVLININKPFPIFSESVKDHIQFLQGDLPIAIASDKPEEIHSWFQTKLDFKVIIPDLSSQGVNLLGARVCSLKNEKAAYIVFEKDKHILSVLMVDAKGLKFPKAKKVAVNNKVFHLSKEKGYSNAMWIDDGIACVFVSDLSEAEILYLASL